MTDKPSNLSDEMLMRFKGITEDMSNAMLAISAVFGASCRLVNGAPYDPKDLAERFCLVASATQVLTSNMADMADMMAEDANLPVDFVNKTFQTSDRCREYFAKLMNLKEG